MSVPETPYTRKEMYLDAIARGDSSGIPERPYTREEMYLDAIAKSGGGGGGGGVGALYVSESQDTLSMTWQQIYDAAIDDDMLVILRTFKEEYGEWYIKYLTNISADEEYNEYIVMFGGTQYSTQSPSGYPEKGSS